MDDLEALLELEGAAFEDDEGVFEDKDVGPSKLKLGKEEKALLESEKHLANKCRCCQRRNQKKLTHFLPPLPPPPPPQLTLF